VSTATIDDDLDPFAELDNETVHAPREGELEPKTEVPTMPSKLQSRHTSFKVPLASDFANGPSSVATLPAEPAKPTETLGQPNIAAASGEVTSLSAKQGESSSLAVAAETTSTLPPVAAATPLTPVAAVPYLTLKIILIPFVCSVVLFFLLWSVVYNTFVTFPLMRHTATTTSLPVQEGLTHVSQRARDEFAEAEGFAEALDLGAAI
jgi:hypothetical protein